MAYITELEILPYVDLGVVTPASFKELAEISRKKCLKRGETGFSAQQISNFTLRGHTCSPQVRDVILNFYKKKTEILSKKLEQL